MTKSQGVGKIGHGLVFQVDVDELDMLIYNFLNLELRHGFLSPRWMMMYGIAWVWLLPRIPVVNEGLLILESPNFLMLTRHPGVVWEG